MKKNWKDMFLISIMVLVIIPLIIAMIINVRLICVDTTNEWIGFWGSYIGAIISAGIAIYVMKETLINERQIRDLDEKSRFLDDLIRKHTDVTKYNKRLLSEVEFVDDQKSIIFKKDMKAFYNACIDFNQSLDELEFLLLIGDYTGKYKDVAGLKKAVQDYSEVNKTLVEILRKERAEDEKTKMEIAVNLGLMTTIESKFKFVFKEFIKVNTIKG